MTQERTCRNCVHAAAAENEPDELVSCTWKHSDSACVPWWARAEVVEVFPSYALNCDCYEERGK